MGRKKESKICRKKKSPEGFSGKPLSILPRLISSLKITLILNHASGASPTDQDLLHRAEDGLLRPPFPCCIAAWWLRQPEPQEEQERSLRRIPMKTEISIALHLLLLFETRYQVWVANELSS